MNQALPIQSVVGKVVSEPSVILIGRLHLGHFAHLFFNALSVKTLVTSVAE
tara:strand:- start:1702 stop:1854 length:153 start_codon:yes stop_codon:yes gene_type:complete